MDPSRIRELVADIAGATANAEPAWEEVAPMGSSILPFLAEAFPRARKWQGRVALVFHCIRHARTSPVAFDLGLLALQDKSYMVRYRACGLLAYSLRNEARVVAMTTSCNSRAPNEERPHSTSSNQTASGKLVAERGLRDGDIIFQESQSNQSDMVRALTRSQWTHMGVIFKASEQAFVLEAVSPVRKTSLQTWISRGRGHRYAVKRLRGAESRLATDTVDRMQRLGATWLGRPYDVRFQWSDDSLYCSELVYKLFERGAGIRLGTLEHASDMNLGNPFVQKAIKQRFATEGFDPTETVVTPDSIFNDNQLVDVEQ